MPYWVAGASAEEWHHSSVDSHQSSAYCKTITTRVKTNDRHIRHCIGRFTLDSGTGCSGPPNRKGWQWRRRWTYAP